MIALLPSDVVGHVTSKSAKTRLPILLYDALLTTIVTVGLDGVHAVTPAKLV
jgi:hypothetical protein